MMSPCLKWEVFTITDTSVPCWLLLYFNISFVGNKESSTLFFFLFFFPFLPIMPFCLLCHPGFSPTPLFLFSTCFPRTLLWCHKAQLPPLLTSLCLTPRRSLSSPSSVFSGVKIICQTLAARRSGGIVAGVLCVCARACVILCFPQICVQFVSLPLHILLKLHPEERMRSNMCTDVNNPTPAAPWCAISWSVGVATHWDC